MAFLGIDRLGRGPSGANGRAEKVADWLRPRLETDYRGIYTLLNEGELALAGGFKVGSGGLKIESKTGADGERQVFVNGAPAAEIARALGLAWPLAPPEPARAVRDPERAQRPATFEAEARPLEGRGLGPVQDKVPSEARVSPWATRLPPAESRGPLLDASYPRSFSVTVKGKVYGCRSLDDGAVEIAAPGGLTVTLRKEGKSSGINGHSYELTGGRLKIDGRAIDPAQVS